MKSMTSIAATLEGYDPQALSATTVNTFLSRLVEPVTTWEAVKQRNIKPDLSSIGGSGSGDLGGGDWDGDSKEKGPVEPPASPPAP